jgi:hypothetical protein
MSCCTERAGLSLGATTSMFLKQKPLSPKKYLSKKTTFCVCSPSALGGATSICLASGGGQYSSTRVWQRWIITSGSTPTRWLYLSLLFYCLLLFSSSICFLRLFYCLLLFSSSICFLRLDSASLVVLATCYILLLSSNISKMTPL